jgi:hypothetical protein
MDTSATSAKRSRKNSASGCYLVYGSGDQRSWLGSLAAALAPAGAEGDFREATFRWCVGPLLPWPGIVKSATKRPPLSSLRLVNPRGGALRNRLARTPEAGPDFMRRSVLRPRQLHGNAEMALNR